jgi:hypothetical protein
MGKLITIDSAVIDAAVEAMRRQRGKLLRVTQILGPDGDYEALGLLARVRTDIYDSANALEAAIQQSSRPAATVLGVCDAPYFEGELAGHTSHRRTDSCVNWRPVAAATSS